LRLAHGELSLTALESAGFKTPANILKHCPESTIGVKHGGEGHDFNDSPDRKIVIEPEAEQQPIGGLEFRKHRRENSVAFGSSQFGIWLHLIRRNLVKVKEAGLEGDESSADPTHLPGFLRFDRSATSASKTRPVEIHAQPAGHYRQPRCEAA